MTRASANVEAELAYLVPTEGRAEHRIYPPNSGRKLVRPQQVYQTMTIHDARTCRPRPQIDEAGFELLSHQSGISDFYDEHALSRDYYPEVVDLLKVSVGAHAVVIFDHNHRSAVRAAAGQIGIRMPVDAAHNDYTPASGPRRARAILSAAGKLEYLDHRLALINVWRPVIGPAQDVPLAICDARSAAPEDFVETDIHHFGEDDLENPRHTGQIYSVRHNPAHRWYYVPDMQPDEVLLLKNWDSDACNRAAYTAHTGFKNPLAPATAIPRESIELRTLVIFA